MTRSYDAAGVGAVRAEVDVLAVESDDGLAGSAVLAVLGKGLGQTRHDAAPVPEIRQRRIYGVDFGFPDGTTSRGQARYI